MRMEHPSAASRSEQYAAGHEERDVAFRPVVIGLAGLVGLLVVGAISMWVLFLYFAARPAGPPANPLAQSFGRQVPPEPRLQTNPLADLQQLRAQEDEILSSYGWVDRNAGVVRIPVEQAIELLAQRGLPARAAERTR